MVLRVVGYTKLQLEEDTMFFREYLDGMSTTIRSYTYTDKDTRRCWHRLFLPATMVPWIKYAPVHFLELILLFQS
jgi:hypothetical protein